MPSKNVVFLIHGIGREADDWSAAPLAELRAAADLSGAFAATPLDDQIQFIPIVYNDIFDLVLARWHQLTTDLRQSGLLLDAPFATLTDVIGDISKPGNTISEYAGDTILYLGFRLVRNAVLLRTISKIVEGITKAYDAYTPGQDREPKFGVVAHSLGTTVAHDALHLLATLPWSNPPPEVAHMKADVGLLNHAGPQGSRIADAILNAFNTNPAAPARFKFDSIFMISNTSRLLHTTELDPYHSCIYPAEIDFPPTGGYCNRFYVVDNRYDFVGLGLKAVHCDFRIDNEHWRQHGIGNSRAARKIELEHLHQANAHDLAHYLKHPLVYREIFRRFASTYDDAHYDAIPQLPNLPHGAIEATASAAWARLFPMLAQKLRRGDNP